MLDINNHLETINKKHSRWPDYVKRLATAVLMTYEYRFVDITEIELVTLIYCGEGGTGIRAHKGSAWLYYNGAFRLFDGLCSKTVLKRMRTFMKHCEGLYKCFKKEKELHEQLRQAFADGIKEVEAGESTKQDCVAKLNKLKKEVQFDADESVLIDFLRAAENPNAAAINGAKAAST